MVCRAEAPICRCNDRTALYPVATDNNSERVTLARIDRDSFPRTALAVAAEFR